MSQRVRKKVTPYLLCWCLLFLILKFSRLLIGMCWLSLESFHYCLYIWVCESLCACVCEYVSLHIYMLRCVCSNNTGIHLLVFSPCIFVCVLCNHVRVTCMNKRACMKHAYMYYVYACFWVWDVLRPIQVWDSMCTYMCAYLWVFHGWAGKFQLRVCMYECVRMYVCVCVRMCVNV